MELTAGAVAAALLATLVGASIQGSIGFGMNLVTVPVLALVLPESLPATAVLLGIPMSLAMVRHEHQSIDRSGLTWILVGRVPGTILGTWVVAAVSVDALKVLIGAFVIGAVALSLGAPPVRLSRSNQFTAGVVSGTTGTAAGIGGPPLALLYQHSSGPTMRSTLAAAFFVGTIFSVLSLAVAGQVLLAHLVLVTLLVPVVVAGSWIGRRLHGVLDRAWLRPAVLAFAAVSGIVVIVDAWW
jgi:hypothetical protein